jgi:hypothetical protein
MACGTTVASAALLAASSGVVAPWLDGHPAGHRAAVAILGALALALVALASSLRGAWSSFDLLHLLVWLHPFQRACFEALGGKLAFATDLGISLALLHFSPGWRALATAAARWWARAGRSGVLRLGASIGFACLVWLQSLATTASKAIAELDPSWQAVVARNFELGKRAGVDWIFTYGPLGHFEVGVHSDSLFWVQRLAYDVCFKVPVAAAFGWWFHGAQGWLLRAAICFAAIVLQAGPDGQAFLSVVLLALAWMSFPRTRSLVWLVPISTLIWLFGLGKFTSFVLGVTACGACSLWAAARSGWRQGIAAALVSALSLLTLWVGVGQRAGDLATWIDHSWEIAKGYGVAMSMPVERGVLWMGLATFLLACVARIARRWCGAERRGDWIPEGLIFAALCLAFKSAFTRHGGANIYFHVAAVVPFLPLIRESERPTPPRLHSSGWRIAALAVVALALGRQDLIRPHGLKSVPKLLASTTESISFQARYVLHPAAWREAANREEETYSTKFRDSRTRSVVGDGSLDVMPNLQAIAIHGGFRWHPRPVIQSYSAYTAPLIELDRAFYAGPSAPDFVLLDFFELDGRFAVQDDGPALLEIFRRYKPRHLEFNHLLMQRVEAALASPPSPIDRPVLWEGTWKPGDGISLEPYQASALLLELDLRLNWRGKLRTLALGAPWALLQVNASDGGTEKFRLVPDSARAGLLVRPYLRSAWSLVRLYSGLPQPQIRSLSVAIASEWLGYFEPEIRARLRDAGDLRFARVPALWSESLTPYVLGSNFHLDFPGNPIIVDAFDEDFLHLHAPTRVTFDATAGEWLLSGRYALDPRVGSLCPEADGIEIKVTIAGSGDRPPLFEDRIEPAPQPESAPPPRSLELPLVLAQDSQVILEIDPRVSHACDWALIKHLSLRRAVKEPAPR